MHVKDGKLEHDATPDEVAVLEAIGDSAAKAIAKWLMSGTCALRWGSDTYVLRRMIAQAIEKGDWKIQEPNDGPR